jgi:hypothetical protein
VSSPEGSAILKPESCRPPERDGAGNRARALNGYNLRKLPLMERKALLKKNKIQFSESFKVDSPEMFKHAYLSLAVFVRGTNRRSNPSEDGNRGHVGSTSPALPRP